MRAHKATQDDAKDPQPETVTAEARNADGELSDDELDGVVGGSISWSGFGGES